MGLSTNRLNWIDVLKGIAILLVVLGHTLDGSPMYNATNWMSKLHMIIYSFHMPLFFFLSGCTFSLSKKNADVKTFALRILELFLVYVIWSFFMYAGKTLLSAEATNKVTFTFPYCLLFSPVDPFWYLIVLLIYSIIGFVVERTNEKVRFCLLCFSFIISAIISIWEREALKNAAELRYLYRIGFHFVFFIGGICFIKKDLLRFNSKLKAVLLFVITIALLFVKQFFIPTNVILFNEITAWACIIFLVSLISQIVLVSNNCIISFFGTNSLYIYCLHNFCTVLCRILLKTKIYNGIIYVCTVFLTTIIICSFAILIINKIKILDIFFMPVKTIDGLRKSKEN